MNTSRNDHFIWFGMSVSIHILILACIFISLQNKPSLVHQPQKKKFAFNVPAPIIFYGHQMAPNKAPGSLSQITPPQQPVQKQAIQNIPKHENLSSLAPLEKKPLEKEHTKKEISLADIFNDARKHFSIPQKTNLQVPGDGAGQPLVIREGDIQYYSLWSTFLNHLNNAARFNRMKNPAPLGEWLTNKLIKNHIQCGITINKKGEVQDIDIILSSGHKPYDELCIQDIWSASPFPPLPDQLGKNVARFEVRTYI